MSERERKMMRMLLDVLAWADNERVGPPWMKDIEALIEELHIPSGIIVKDGKVFRWA